MNVERPRHTSMLLTPVTALSSPPSQDQKGTITYQSWDQAIVSYLWDPVILLPMTLLYDPMGSSCQALVTDNLVTEAKGGSMTVWFIKVFLAYRLTTWIYSL